MNKVITILASALFGGAMLLTSCGGSSAESKGYLMPALSVNDYCGDFADTRAEYGYLMPAQGLFLKMHVFGTDSYVIHVYSYEEDGEGNLNCTPGHGVHVSPKGGEVQIDIKESSLKNTPSFVFKPTPNCEYSDYVATEQVVRKYYYLCSSEESRQKFESLFADERYAPLKELVFNYPKK